MSNDMSNPKLSRRNIIKAGGIALAGVWGQNHVPAMAAIQRPIEPTAGSASKTVFLPPADSVDPAVHSRAENLFWAEAMMEHAGFFVMLMPGTELASQRGQAETFHRVFQAHLDRARTTTFDRNNFAAFSRSTIELMKPLIEYKQRMLAAQDSGKMRTMVFSHFFDHTIREGQRAAARLERIATGDITVNYSEVIDFWSPIMSDHNEYIAHFLDPQEQDLIGEALDASAVFQGFKNGNYKHEVRGADVLLATENLIDFETMIQEGIETNSIKSIIHPTLANHVHRETVKFVDELKRSGTKT